MGTWIRGGLPVAAFAFVVGACGTSSSTSINPNSPSESRCAVTATAQPASVGAPGGSGTISVSTNRECAWEARSEADWLSLGSTRSGQGDGAVQYTAATNPIVSERRGAVVVNGQRVEIGQAAAACLYALSRPGLTVGAAGGQHDLDVSAQNGCPWTAVSQVPWIEIGSGGSGNGGGRVVVNVQPNAAFERRVGTLTVAGQTYTVEQAAASPVPCTFVVAPTTGAFPAEGGGADVAVTASADTCEWSATTATPWIRIEGSATGRGSGTIRYSVVAHTGADARTGQLTIAGQTIEVTQAGVGAPPPPSSPPPPTCTFTVAPLSAESPAEGTTNEIAVTASAPTCAWTSQPDVPWISIQGAAGGTGSGRLRYVVAANPTTAARSGTLVVAGATVTITQAGAATPPPPPPTCTFTVAPTTASVPATATAGEVVVTASAPTCSWTASSADGWLSIQAPAGGTGSGRLGYSVAANTATSPRTGQITVAGTTVTITQAAAEPPPCTFTVSPLTFSIGPLGEDRREIRVEASGSTCGWTAASQAGWITVTSGSSGTGTGNVRIAIAPTLQLDARVGVVLVAGQNVTITQSGFVSEEITLNGTISNLAGTCPGITFTIGGRTVVADASTAYERGDACTDVRNGRTARVRGRTQVDGSVTATRIERIEDDLTGVRAQEDEE